MDKETDKKLNGIILHYEELGGLDIEAAVTPKDIADFVALRSPMHRDTDQLERSPDFVDRVYGAAFKFIMEMMDQEFEISECMGWYEIIQDDERFYNFMKAKNSLKAVMTYLGKNDPRDPAVQKGLKEMKKA